MANLTDRMEAVVCQLTSAGSIKDRLYQAYSKHLSDLDETDFPKAMRDEFHEMHVALHRERALPGDSVLRASLRKLSIDDASRYAERLVRMYGRLTAMKAPPAVQALPRAAVPLPRVLSSESGGEELLVELGRRSGP